MSKTINPQPTETTESTTAALPTGSSRGQVESLGLTDPRIRPDAHVVIFDGDCHFCQSQVKRLNWFDGGGRLAYLSLHDPRAKELCPDLDHDQLMEQMFVVVNEEGQFKKRHGGAGAIRFLSRALPRLWWLAPIMHIPFSLPVWQWLYMKVAVRRYRWNRSGDEQCEDACEIHLKK